MVLDSRWPRRHHPSCFGSERGKSELEAMLHHYQPVVMANLSDRVGLYSVRSASLHSRSSQIAFRWS
jgi:hypothetical protein